jgi:hypothetical protein
VGPGSSVHLNDIQDIMALPSPDLAPTQVSAADTGSHSTSSSKDEAEVRTSGTPGDHGEEDAADSSGNHSDDESRQKNHSYKRAEEPPRNEDGKMVCKYQECRGTSFDRRCEWR